MNQRLFIILLSLNLASSPLVFAENDGDEKVGHDLYQVRCARCHHPDRIGISAPPLLPPFLKRKSEKVLVETIRDGLHSTQMPAAEDLSEVEIKSIIKYIKQPGTVSWEQSDIEKSRVIVEAKEKPKPYTNLRELTAVVERGRSQVWIMEREEILHKFPFDNVHGGLKFASDGRFILIPSRDGWIGRYSVDTGKLEKIRCGVYLRNISLSRDSSKILVSCWLPSTLVVLNSDSLVVEKVVTIDGKTSSIHALASQPKAIITLRDRAKMGFLNTETLEVKWQEVSEPFEDFFLDPFERFLIGSARRGTALRVFDLKERKTVFTEEIEGMPHLNGAAVWYRKEGVFFATPHITLPVVTIWQMYDWKLIKTVQTESSGYFARTHARTPYVWCDNYTDNLLLIDKVTFAVEKRKPIPGKKIIHTEFSDDGQLAYVSVYDNDGKLLIYDTGYMKVIKEHEASLPVGKYNFVHKQHRFSPIKIGKAVFNEKCWGCHHEQNTAFGPAFQKIAKERSLLEIIAQVHAPEEVSKLLGYERNAMSKIPLTEEEINALKAYFSALKEQ